MDFTKKSIFQSNSQTIMTLEIDVIEASKIPFLSVTAGFLFPFSIKYLTKNLDELVGHMAKFAV